MLVLLPTDEQLERMLTDQQLELVVLVLPEPIGLTIDQLVERLPLREALLGQQLEVGLELLDQQLEAQLDQIGLTHQAEVALDHLLDLPTDLTRLVDQVQDHLADLIRLVDQAADRLPSEVLLAEVVQAEVLPEEIKKKQDYCCIFQINAYL